MAKHPAEERRVLHAGAEGKEETGVSSAPGRVHEASPSPMGAGHRDLGVGLVVLAVCALLFFETTRFAAVSAALSQGIPASFFPRILLVTVAILAFIMILRGWRAEREPVETPAPRILATAAIIVLGVVLIPVLGILPMIGLTALTLPLLWGERRPIPLAIYTLSLPLAIWGVFSQLLQLRFPTGLLGL